MVCYDASSVKTFTLCCQNIVGDTLGHILEIPVLYRAKSHNLCSKQAASYMLDAFTEMSLSSAWYLHGKWNWWVLLLKGNPKQPLRPDLMRLPDRNLTKQGTSRGWNALLLDMCGAFQGQAFLAALTITNQTYTGYLKADDRQLQETGSSMKDIILLACLFMERVWGKK